MSFDIFWEKLDNEVANKDQTILNNHFRNNTINNKPSFIGDIEISDLDFGTIPPLIEVIDITDPFPEFYLSDSATTVEVESGTDSVESQSLSDGTAVNNNNNVVGGGDGDSSSGKNGGGNKNKLSPMQIILDRTQEYIYYEQQEHQKQQNRNKQSFLQYSNNDDDNYNYNDNDNSNSNNHYYHHSYKDEDTEYIVEYVEEKEHLHFVRTPEEQLLEEEEEEIVEEQDHEEGHEEEVTILQDTTDTQIHVAISYKGDMKMTITTELFMNYPSMRFMSLPIRLNVTGFEFSATAVVAFFKNRVNFCFLESKNSEESPLKDVHIESEIGDKEKQVLKNVGKLEKFIVNQLRKLIEEDFVFPSYHSIDLQSTQ